MKERDTGTGDLQADAILVRMCRDGDRNACDRLVLRHKDRVFNICYSFLGDYDEANDLAQEVFIKVHRGLSKFRLESSFSTWIYRITVNTCKNRVKSLSYRFKKQRKSIDNPGGAAGNEAVEPANGGGSPAARLEARERAAAIRQAVNSLSPDRKSVIVLRDMEGLSYSEIAGITGLKAGTVKSRIARAREELKNKLAGMI